MKISPLKNRILYKEIRKVTCPACGYGTGRITGKRPPGSKIAPNSGANIPVISGDHSLAKWVGVDWKMPAPETCDAIRNAATTAGRLMSLRN
jgi:hypothetical protein